MYKELLKMRYLIVLKIGWQKILVVLVFGYQQVIRKYLNTENFPIYGTSIEVP